MARCVPVLYRAVTVSGRAFQAPSRPVPHLSALPYNPGLHAGRFRLLPFRSPLLRESSLFLRVLRCFSSPGSPRQSMCSPDDAQAFPRAGFPIRTSPALTGAHPSPELFAVYHVLPRHLAPRHPPYALRSLSEPLLRRFRCSRVTSRMLLLRCPGNPPVTAPLPAAWLSPTGSHGDEGTRTPDFLRAKQALSQLSYVPQWV